MTAPRHCHSCSGPRPRAAIRCPWCLRDYDAAPMRPQHLFAHFEGESARMSVPVRASIHGR
ncbi:MAG: hypothetical protein ACO1OK_06340 [Devosia sp.]